jgi:hypothetical protein
VRNVKNRYLILHKNFPVASVILDEDYDIEKIEKIHSKERLPVGLFLKQISVKNLNGWLFGRAIPQKRNGLKQILEATKTRSNQELLIKNLGLGLTDCYWIKPENASLSWDEINFFQNIFSKDVEKIYLRESSDDGNIDLINNISPSNVSSGMLPKGWICRKNKRYMIKGSELENYQEPYNEVIISRWLDVLGIDHVDYWLKYIDKKPYSVCENMLIPGEELISAYYISNIIKKDNKDSFLDHYIKCCKELGLNDSIRQDLDNMILIDYISANTDRHWSNFGVIRDSDTLRAKKLAPIYDNGASMFAKIHYFDIKEINNNLKCQSFNSKQEENIKLVTNFSLLGNQAVISICDTAMEEFNKNKYMDENRKREIVLRIKQRITMAGKKLRKKAK